MNYTLKHPVFITSRVMAGIKVGDGTISIEVVRKKNGDVQRTRDKRLRYKYYIDTPEFSYTKADLKSGCCARDNAKSLSEGLRSLLSFLSACADANAPGEEPGESADLFPKHVGEWAYQNDSEIGMAQIELEETPDAIT